MPPSIKAPEASAFAALTAKLCPRDGSVETSVPGVYLTRFSTTATPRTTLSQAVFCVPAQGAKSILVNGERNRYDASHFLLVSLDLPLVGQIEEATVQRPFLGFSLVIDFEEVSAVVLDAGLKPQPVRPERGIAVGRLDKEMADAVLRLVRLAQTPEHARVLSPLIRKEIYYRLLIGEQGGALYRMASNSGKAQRIAGGLAWLRQNATRPIRMQELARELHMSQSTMNAWFREVTLMSPLQFQKQLRLEEARRLMLTGTFDAGSAGRQVGYESASQFTREYRRFFGAPPLRDIDAMRKSAFASRRTVVAGELAPGQNAPGEHAMA